MRLFLSLFLMSSTVSWGVFLDEERVLTLTIAREGLTRLSVRQDKIQDVFVHPAEASNHLQLHQSGHVFITPEGLTGPLSVTLLTQGGTVQDLRLKTSPKKVAPIYLETRAPLPPPVSLRPKTRSPEDVLKDLMQTGESPGFQETPPGARPRFVEGVRFERVRSWSNGTVQVLQFQGPEGAALSLVAARRGRDRLLAMGPPAVRPSFWVLCPLQSLQKGGS